MSDDERLHWQRMEIEDTSDCLTCTRRDIDTFAMLAEVKIAVLDGVTCPECGRTISLVIEEEGGQP